MDSGSTVPTLKPGFSEMVAVKLLSVAAVRRDEAPGTDLASGVATGVETGLAGLMVLRKAFFLAALRAGRSNPASTATMTMTTSNSIKVKALP
jgi:hypothetical protein